jgi:hypothetical protein
MRSLRSHQLIKIVVLIAHVVTMAAAFAPSPNCVGAELDGGCSVEHAGSTPQSAQSACCSGCESCESCGSSEHIPQSQEHSLVPDSPSGQTLLRSCLLAAPFSFLQNPQEQIAFNYHVPEASGHCAPHIRSVVLRS